MKVSAEGGASCPNDFSSTNISRPREALLLKRGSLSVKSRPPLNQGSPGQGSSEDSLTLAGCLVPGEGRGQN